MTLRAVAGGGMVVGSAVTGGTANRILYVGATGLLADSANLTFGPTAGLGITLAAGTATTDVNAQSWTQTWNAAGVTFTTLKSTTTTTAYTANSMLFDFATSGTAHRIRANLTTGQQDLTITGPASGAARLILQGNGATNNHQISSPNAGPLTLDSYTNGISLNISGAVAIGIDTAGDIKWGKALVALGGGAAPTLGTIGGTGPAAAAQNSWMRVLDSTGAAFWVPAWK